MIKAALLFFSRNSQFHTECQPVFNFGQIAGNEFIIGYSIVASPGCLPFANDQTEVLFISVVTTAHLKSIYSRGIWLRRTIFECLEIKKASDPAHFFYF